MGELFGWEKRCLSKNLIRGRNTTQLQKEDELKCGMAFLMFGEILNYESLKESTALLSCLDFPRFLGVVNVLNNNKYGLYKLGYCEEKLIQKLKL